MFKRFKHDVRAGTSISQCQVKTPLRWLEENDVTMIYYCMVPTVCFIYKTQQCNKHMVVMLFQWSMRYHVILRYHHGWTVRQRVLPLSLGLSSSTPSWGAAWASASLAQTWRDWRGSKRQHTVQTQRLHSSHSRNCTGSCSNRSVGVLQKGQCNV